MFNYDQCDLIFYPNQLLRKKAAPVTVFNDDVRRKAYLMHKIMSEKFGIGLAANQIGLLERIIVVDAKVSDNNNRSYFTYINPEIISGKDEYVHEEGCLSHPGIYLKIKRYREIVLKYQDVDGKFHEQVFESIPGKIHAQVIQHELDHLDGINLPDKMTPGQKMVFDNKLRKLEKLFRKNK